MKDVQGSTKTKPQCFKLSNAGSLSVLLFIFLAFFGAGLVYTAYHPKEMMTFFSIALIATTAGFAIHGVLRKKGYFMIIANASTSLVLVASKLYAPEMWNVWLLALVGSYFLLADFRKNI